MAPRPNTCSMKRAPASSLASPRPGATICRPTGRWSAVKPQGMEIAGHAASVIAVLLLVTTLAVNQLLKRVAR